MNEQSNQIAISCLTIEEDELAQLYSQQQLESNFSNLLILANNNGKIPRRTRLMRK